ncbi:biotin/lipoyl-binding protein [Desulfofundulus thermocisternus]|uniref:biotin/lipoyl-binding protein n=1 Tax=Desulfofundulus thermocisternus TaxID=42471 RepID=UPI00217DD3B5|nr:biotin/lipoyl-binding protein [Desulfofundulus thermocisternus]MCS5695456.1 biotin/lipoyl-binding protein [Desulfofundulus thermocisternus]
MVNAPEVDVTTKIPGRVVKLLVREGDSVAQGQLVAEIDSTDLRASFPWNGMKIMVFKDRKICEVNLRNKRWK